MIKKMMRGTIKKKKKKKKKIVCVNQQ